MRTGTGRCDVISRGTASWSTCRDVSRDVTASVVRRQHRAEGSRQQTGSGRSYVVVGGGGSDVSRVAATNEERVGVEV